MAAAIIEVLDLRFSYGTAPVLQGATLTVNQGDFVGIIGPNGSGKSTLLKNMAAILTPAGGTILLDGIDLVRWGRRELSRKIALTGQDGSSAFNFLVEDIVAMGRYPYAGRFTPLRETDRRAVERAMHLTGCYQLKDRELFSLSGGERQRVMLARALAQETPLLMLDEPTTFLDIGYQVELMELLQSINQSEKVTVVMVLHDLNLASRYCRKLFLLHQGRIQAWGAPPAVLTRENILEVYRTEVLIEPHPLGGYPLVTPVGKMTSTSRQQCRRRVHVIGGGGSAGPLLKELYLAGIPLSAGVLSAGDADWAAARRLGLPTVEEAPFAPISRPRHEENLRLVEQAGAVVLAPIYFGSGNLLNLRAAEHAVRKRIPLFMINEPPVEERDFVDGAAVELYKHLEQSGAIMVKKILPSIIYPLVR